jgi:tetratricopeptide (TPR) repeat protein
MTPFTRQGMAPATALVLTAIVTALLAGCGSKTPKPDEAPAPPTSTTLPPLSSTSSQAPMQSPALPPTAAAQQQAQKSAQGVIDLLEVGNEEQARKELQNALSLDPNNKLALSLMKQMTEDPVATLGKESFPYVVRSGDTLSRISGRFLGDIYSFHILARYNNIKVPRQVGAGQTLRIPGKAPPPGALTANEPVRPAANRPDSAAVAPAPAAAPPAVEAVSPADTAFRSGDAASKAGMLEKALSDYKKAAALGHPTAATQADATAKRLIDIHSRNAMAAMARQDLDGAVRSWDRVLEIEPDNETARLEKQKALRLKDKVKALPG